MNDGVEFIQGQSTHTLSKDHSLECDHLQTGTYYHYIEIDQNQTSIYHNPSFAF